MPALSTLVSGYLKRQTRIPQLVFTRLSDLTVLGTPFDTSSAQASWTPSIGSPKANNVIVESGPRYPQRATVAAVARTLKIGESASLANGLPYIRRLEYGSHSAQAPSGMLRIAVAQHQAVTDEAVREVRRGA